MKGRTKDLIDAKTRQAILAGEFPALTWPGDKPCPVEKDQEIGFVYLRSLAGPVVQVAITITAIRRGKKGEHLADYSVRDDRPLYLRHRRGFTRSPADSTDPDAPITDEKTLREYSARSRLRAAEREERADEARRKRARAVRDRLRETLEGLQPEAQMTLLVTMEREIRKASMRNAA